MTPCSEIKNLPLLVSTILSKVDILVTGDKDFFEIVSKKPKTISPSGLISEYEKILGLFQKFLLKIRLPEQAEIIKLKLLNYTRFLNLNLAIHLLLITEFSSKKIIALYQLAL